MLSVAFAVSGCRAKIRPKVKNSAPAPIAAIAVPPGTPRDETPRGTPVALDDSFASERLFYQSRTPIALRLAANLAAPGDWLSLVNETTKAVLIEGSEIDVADGETQQLGAATLSTSLLAPTMEYELLVRLFPLDPEYAGGWAYGENLLRVSAGDMAPDARIGVRRIEIRDFPTVGFAAASLPEATQRQDGIEVEFGIWKQSVVRNANSVLSFGMIQRLSR